ncbi:MAG TPA: hypothetical protein PLX89_09695 [Verrucomicrobiota bacterium]|nr:hypothetical protein [Verrucomicrobiales bacterium]HRI13268.1 hypothetical protein [Verrucomicrobiota bacterium]
MNFTNSSNACLRYIRGNAVLLTLILLCGSDGLTADPNTNRTATVGLSVSRDGSLRLNGAVYRGFGVNYYDAFVRTLAEPPTQSYEAGFATLATHRVPFARFSAGGYWPADWGLYLTNRAEHFRRLDGVFRSAERYGIGLIPSLFWLTSTVPDLMREPVNAWGDTNSRTHAFMIQYTRAVVERYRASPALWGWEFGNEYNLAADLPNAAEHRPPVVPNLGTPATRSKQDELSHAMIRTALQVFAREVRRLDPNRIIVSGNAFPRLSAWHQAARGTWETDTATQFAEMLAADNPSPIDTLSVRGYDLKTDLGRIPQAMAVAAAVKKPLLVGEFGVPGRKSTEAQAAFSSVLQCLVTNQVPLAALWVFDFAAQSADWSVTTLNDRGWQLEEIAQANQRIRAENQ